MKRRAGTPHLQKENDLQKAHSSQGMKTFPQCHRLRKYPNWRCSSERGLQAPKPLFFFFSLSLCNLSLAICWDTARTVSESEQPFSKGDGVTVHSPCTYRSHKQSCLRHPAGVRKRWAFAQQKAEGRCQDFSWRGQQAWRAEFSRTL